MRLRLKLGGNVQGVGFRPFVWRLANSLNLKGYVLNSPKGVIIEVEGDEKSIELFKERLLSQAPKPVRKIRLEKEETLEEVGYSLFTIKESELSGERKVLITPDIATCPDCLKEIADKNDRRYRYPFTNCTACGPRFTIIESLPYDRVRTSMKVFKMCSDCEKEYRTPGDRRFHAQPNACPVCGPQVYFLDGKGRKLAEGDDAIRLAVSSIREGRILALKGLGGFHLVVSARNREAVKRLRDRKKRPHKPFAVMFPSLNYVEKVAYVSEREKEAITSPEAPIVVLRVKDWGDIDGNVSGGFKNIGAFLPYTPLHHIILSDLKEPIIATSGNASEEPICIDDKEALDRLNNIADAFLMHTRPIVRRCDDSVLRFSGGDMIMMRRSRGFVPMPVELPFRLKEPVLAVGGHLKNTFCLAIDNRAFLSQHIGDLDNPLAREFFSYSIVDLEDLLGIEPKTVIMDMHPGYFSTIWASKLKIKKMKVQHHIAHLLSVLIENQALDKNVIGIVLDGTGYGVDGSIWGGELFLYKKGNIERIGHLLEFPLVGGEKAIMEPWRLAYIHLYKAGFIPNGLFKDLDPKHIKLLEHGIKKGMGIKTSSMGRLFDAVSFIILGIKSATFEAHAPMLLEDSAMLYEPSENEKPIPIPFKDGILDWRPLLKEIAGMKIKGYPPEQLSYIFHLSLAKGICSAVYTWAKNAGIKDIALSGGVLQNALLLRLLKDEIGRLGLNPIIHKEIPPNDGGISLGQVGAVFLNYSNLIQLVN